MFGLSFTTAPVPCAGSPDCHMQCITPLTCAHVITLPSFNSSTDEEERLRIGPLVWRRVTGDLFQLPVKLPVLLQVSTLDISCNQ